MKITRTGITNHPVQTGTATRAAETAEVYEAAETPQTLADFKKEIHARISAMTRHPSQAGASTAINITDKAFEQMMADPAKKEEVLGLIQRELNGNYGPASPSYIVLNFDDDCVYSGSAAGSAYGSWFSGASSGSFWTNRPGSRELAEKALEQRREQQRLEEKQLEQSLMSTREWQEHIAVKSAEQRQIVDSLLSQLQQQA